MENVSQVGLPNLSMSAMMPEQSQPLPLASNYRLVNGKACKIPRPMNAFMLYAVDHRKILSKQYPKEHNKEISMRLGNMWRELPENAKKRYFDLAKQAEIQHRMRYPNYSYNPKPTKKKRSLEGRRDDILMLGPNPNPKDLSELQKSDGVLSSLLRYDTQRQPLVSTQPSVLHNTSGGKMIPVQNSNAPGQYMLRYQAPMTVQQGMIPRPQGRMPHPLMMFRGPAPQGMMAVRGPNHPDGRNTSQTSGGTFHEASPSKQGDQGLQVPNQPGGHFQPLKHQGSHFQPVHPHPRSPGGRYAPYPPRFVYMPCNMAYASKMGWPQDGMQHQSFPAPQMQHFDNNMNPQNSYDNYGGYFQMTDQMFGNLEQPTEVSNTTESLSEDDDDSNETVGEERSYTDLSNASQDIVYVQDSNNNNAAVSREDKAETAQATQALLDLVSDEANANPRASETVIKWDRATDKYIVSEKHPEIMIPSPSFLSSSLNQDNTPREPTVGNFIVSEKQSDVMIPSPNFLNNAVALENYPQNVNAAPNTESLFAAADDEPFVPQNCQTKISPNKSRSSIAQASIVKRESI